MLWEERVREAEARGLSARHLARDLMARVVLEELFVHRNSAAMALGLAGFVRWCLERTRPMDVQVLHLAIGRESRLRGWATAAVRSIQLRLVGLLGPGRLSGRLVKDPRAKSRWRWTLEFRREGGWEVVSCHVEFLIGESVAALPRWLSAGDLPGRDPAWLMVPCPTFLYLEGVQRLALFEGEDALALADLAVLRQALPELLPVDVLRGLVSEAMGGASLRRFRRQVQNLELSPGGGEASWLTSYCSWEEVLSEHRFLVQEVCA